MAQNNRTALGRFLFLLGLAIWLGGLGMVGIMAPVVFRIAREQGVEALAPQMVGAVTGRFNFVTWACGLLMLLGWWLDGERPSSHRTLRRVQGVSTALMLAVALYLGLILSPRLGTLQHKFMPQFQPGASGLSLPPRAANDPVRDEFDVGHKRYTGLSQAVLLLGLLSLGAFCLRTVAGREELARGTALENEQKAAV